MASAIARASHSRVLAPPNPWVGALVVTDRGVRFEGATQPPGGAHAEVEALRRAGSSARGSQLFVTLEPCSHHGRTPPCVDAIIEAGIRRVVVAMVDPDSIVAGRGIDALGRAGIEVVVGPGQVAAAEQLAPYIKHRTTGLPYVVLKLASTMDGRTAAADGTSKWITSAEARSDAHQLRAESGAILVGAGTVRDDDPHLTVRGMDLGSDENAPEPLRVVLGKAPEGASVHPCLEVSGDLEDILGELGRREVLQVLVEGGANVAGQFHRQGLVDRYVLYQAPALMGGADGRPLLDGPGAPTIDGLARFELAELRRIGPDVRVDLVPRSPDRNWE